MSLGSLERKLPILIGGLVACAVLAALLLVRFELRRNAVDMAGERLALVTGQLDELVETTVSARIETTERIAAEPVLAAWATGAGTDEAAVRAALDRLRVPSDSGLPIELRALDGRTLVSTGAAAPTTATVSPERGPAELTDVPLDSVTYTRLKAVGDEVRYEIMAPVRSDDRAVAHVVQHRRVDTSGNGERIERLIGSSAQIYFTNVDGGVWTSLNGDVRLRVPAPPFVDAPFEYEHEGERMYAFARPIAGTSWLIVTQMPIEATLVGTGRVLRRLTLVGIVLLLLGGLGAWLVSRSVTRPLNRLGEAADAIAAGDYDRRTGVRGDDEIGRLAASFDVMAGRVATTHREIEQRYEQAQALGAELERANLRLTEAIHEAERARAEAQQANAAKSEFLATMSHEIRTPINAVLGYTELMEMELPGPLTDQQREYMGRVRLSGAHLISLVNDVLDFAKIEAGQMRLQHEVGTLAMDIGAAVAMLQTTAQSRDIDVVADCSANTHYSGDPRRVQQILINLLSNAIKFSDAGTQVTVKCERRESRPLPDDGSREQISWVCASITDEGIGIQPDQLEAIFEPFVQGAGGYTRRHGGTGLGLAISRSLARMMDGDITVESTPRAGSTFSLWLPAA